ncbi:hypothetical protein [Clostridium lacusfryxellense]|nr:hypothetical protein [Clostridium lacusfryxellense]
MFNKEISTNAYVKFNFIISNGINTPKTLYDSPTLMKVIFS